MYKYVVGSSCCGEGDKVGIYKIVNGKAVNIENHNGFESREEATYFGIERVKELEEENKNGRS